MLYLHSIKGFCHPRKCAAVNAQHLPGIHRPKWIPAIRRYATSAGMTIILLITSTSAHARWANFADAPYEIVFASNDIRVHKDGTAEATFETQIKILNESGRDAFAAVPLYYVKDNSELEIQVARIINDEQVYDLDPDTIEDKPLASAIKGFDQNHQVLLAFPNIQVGSILHLKHVRKILKPDLPGFFQTYINFSGQYMKTSKYVIKSETPLYTNVNNFAKYLKISRSKEGKLHVLTVTLDRPIFISIVDEYQNNINPDKYPWVYITTNDNWTQISKQIATPYLKVMQQPLPALYQEILDAAREQTDPVQQINTVTSMLNDRVQYMGDWKSAKGRFVPQDLATVAQRRMGDCKDFATGTAVILNQLGMQANVALVYRKAGIYYTIKNLLPGLTHYNHAIVRVQVGTNTYWVDPTNFFSIADVVLPDIADRPTLVLMQEPRSENIPPSLPSQNVLDGVKDIDLRNPALANVTGTFNVGGLSALEYTGAELQTSKNTIMNALLTQVGNFEYMLDQSVNLPPLTSRIVHDLNFKYKFKEKDYVSMCNAGYLAQGADMSTLAAGFIFNPAQVSDVYLGAPGIGKKIYNYNNIEPAGTLPLDTELRSPWLDISRKVNYLPNGVQVILEYEIKKSWLPNEVIRSAEYMEMAKSLSRNFSSPISIVFK